MATLLDLQNATDSDMKRGIIRNIIDTSAILSKFSFETAPSLRYEFASEGDLPNPAFRALNTSYNDSEGAFNLNTIQLKPFGGSFIADRKLKRQPTFDQIQWLAKQLEMHSRAISLDWKKNIFNGNVGVTPAGFNGIQVLVQSLESSQRVDFGGGNLATSAAVTLDKINQAIDETETIPDLIACNRQHLRDLDSVTRTQSNDVIAEKFKLTVIEVNGVKKRIGMWDDIIPMIPVDKDSDQDEILDFTEGATGAPGTSGALSSMYFISGMQGNGFVLLGDMEAPEVTVFEEGPGTQAIVDWALGIAIQNPRSLTQLFNIASS